MEFAANSFDLTNVSLKGLSLILDPNFSSDDCRSSGDGPIQWLYGVPLSEVASSTYLGNYQQIGGFEQMRYCALVGILVLAIIQLVASELHQKGTCSIYGNVSI